MLLSLVACATIGVGAMTFRDSIAGAIGSTTGCIMGSCEQTPAQSISQDSDPDSDDDTDSERSGNRAGNRSSGGGDHCSNGRGRDGSRSAGCR